MILTKLSYLVIFTLIIGMMTLGFVSAEVLPVENIGGGKGYYDISSNPEGGTVIFDGSNKGTTPVTVEVSTLRDTRAHDQHLQGRVQDVH